MKHKKDAELYLKTYSELRKWINECPVCHSKGYKQNMPEHIGNEDCVAAHYIRMYFQPLEVDEMGICLQCSKYLKATKIRPRTNK